MTEHTILKLIKLAEEISKDEYLSPEDKFNLIFSDNVSTKIYKKLKEFNIKFEYYDPDQDYEDDIDAYVTALKENEERFANILKYVDIS